MKPYRKQVQETQKVPVVADLRTPRRITDIRLHPGDLLEHRSDLDEFLELLRNGVARGIAVLLIDVVNDTAKPV